MQPAPLRILSVLGQKPGMTGSGVLLEELWQCAHESGDRQEVIVAGYPGDDFSQSFGGSYTKISYSNSERRGTLPFPVLGMSDVMPYESMRYSDATPIQVEQHLQEVRDAVGQRIKAFQPDLVHIHHLWVLVSLARHYSESPCFVTVHGTGLKQLRTASKYRHYVESGLPFVKMSFCVSHDMLDDAVAAYGIPSDRICFMGNGFNERV